MESSPNTMNCKYFVLVNIPTSFKKYDVLDYVEGTLDIDVTEVKMYPPFPGKALVFLKDTLANFESSVEKIKQAPIGSQEVIMLPTHKLDAVFVNEYDPQDLPEDYLQMYFESTFANGESVVKSCHVLKEHQMAVVYFYAEFREAVDKILKTDRHAPLSSMSHSIVVSPCFHNFNDIQQGDVDANGEESDDEESDSDDKASTSEKSDSDEEETSNNETADSDDDHHDNKNNDHLNEHNREEKADLKQGHFLQAKNAIGTVETKTEFNHPKVKKGNAHTEETLSSSSESDSNNSGYSSSDEEDDIETEQPETIDMKTFHKNKNDESSETEEDDLMEPQQIGDTNLKSSHNSKTTTEDDSDDIDDSSEEDEDFFDAEESYTRKENLGLDLEEIRKKCPKTGKVGSGIDEMVANATSGIKDSDQQQLCVGQIKSERSANVVTYDSEKPRKASQVYGLSQEDKAIQQTNESERIHHCQKSLPVSKAQAHFLQPIFNADHKGFSVYFYKRQEKAIFYGNEDCIDECYLEMQKAQRNVKEKRLKLSEATKSVLCREKGKTYLHSFKERGAYVYVTGSELVIAAVIEDVFQSTCKSFEAKINCEETRKSDVEIPDEELKRLKHYLEAEVLVYVQWAENQKEIFIGGIKDDILVSMKEIEELMNKYSEYEKIFEVIEDKALYLYKFCEDRLESILKSVKLLQRVFKKDRVFIKFHGSKGNAETAYQELRSLEKELTTEKTDLKELFKDPQDQRVMSQFFLSGTLKPGMHHFEHKNRCVVSFGMSNRDKIASSPPQEDKPPAVLESKAGSHQPQERNFSVTATCKLVIKDGDVTQEKSDVLVCTLDKHVDLRRTNVGGLFNKSVPHLWRKLKEAHNSNRNASVLTVPGPFEKNIHAKAICHVILSKWEPRSPDSSIDHLIKVVTDVIDQATAMGASSVSFPPMGLGRMFRFPASEVSQIMVATIESVLSSKQNSSLNKIVLLAPEEELYSKFTTEASKHFTDLSSPVKGATGGVAPNNDATESRDDDSDIDTDNENSDDNLGETTHTFDADGTFNLKISVTYLKSGRNASTWQELVDYISQQCLYTDYFREDIIPFWPEKSLKQIFKKAKEHCVFLQRCPAPRSGKKQFVLKGKESPVKEMIHFIWSEFHNISRSNPESRIISSTCPARGTLEFLQHASFSQEKCPSYWKLYKSKNFYKKITRSKESKIVRTIDRKTEKAIEELVMKSWDGNNIGTGADARSLNHSGIKVISVHRIENLTLFEPYFTLRKQLFQRKNNMKQLCTDIGKIKGSRGGVLTSEKMEEFMKEELYTEINEHYLFHGTKDGLLDTIAKHGLDPKMSNHKSMLGKGIYFAETPTKSDQYTDAKQNRSTHGTHLTLIMARVLLGEVSMLGREHKTIRAPATGKLNRPPCRQCGDDKCTDAKHELCDSVMAETDFLYREFVIYDLNRCYPEYVIMYKRV